MSRNPPPHPSDTASNLQRFRLTRVLDQNTEHKTLYLLGKVGEQDEDAVLLLEKQTLPEDAVQRMLGDSSTTLELGMKNDIYSLYTSVSCLPDVNRIKVTMIFPATQRHIDKYSKKRFHIIHETPHEYQAVTLPFLQERQEDLRWVENILDKKAERERMLVEDDDPDIGFALVADLKWDQELSEELYVLAICRLRGLRTLRDLRQKHIPMLRNILEKSTACLAKRYNLARSEIRAFLHYQPSYYHLHVHFTHVQKQLPGLLVGKAHLLETVLYNLENIDPDYYAKCMLSFNVPESDPLFTCFQQAGHLAV